MKDTSKGKSSKNSKTKGNTENKPIKKSTKSSKESKRTKESGKIEAKTKSPRNTKVNQGTQGLLTAAMGIGGGMAADLAVEVTGNVVSNYLNDALFGKYIYCVKIFCLI